MSNTIFYLLDIFTQHLMFAIGNVLRGRRSLGILWLLLLTDYGVVNWVIPVCYRVAFVLNIVPVSLNTSNSNKITSVPKQFGVMCIRIANHPRSLNSTFMNFLHASIRSRVYIICGLSIFHPFCKHKTSFTMVHIFTYYAFQIFT